ncbi:nucleotidyltransferase [Paenibacillus glycanilyticus]|uniref:nucleotidyltransferase n=1 Tax=Paenibacillus glycanilyticus TaxID=126569 RepID=UPI00203D20DE|nr:nucleotidyltransferase [Paenibacillus glycanilyticus]MCM3625993.1 nucleotidyltransferase [Paenibacillus glycanilyticus]
MRTVGLIVEYNPFHNGHQYHLQESVKIANADAVVAVMSGHFLQRGEPAVMDKWARTEAALRGGCDLVLELPTAYATQAAEWFAYGAVSLLEATGVVDAFCFGTESGEIDALQEAARLIAHEPPEFQVMLREALDGGVSYPSAYSTAIAAYLTAAGRHEAASFPFAQPNHTLGLHYLIALERIKGRMRPYTIRREKSEYGQTTVTDSAIASATAIRRLLLEGGELEASRPLVPASTFDVMQREWASGRSPVSWANFAHPLLHAAVTHTPDQLAGYREMMEGLEYRLLQSLPKLVNTGFETLLDELKTKRYTRTKLQRALLSILLHHKKEDFTPEKLAAGVQYIRVLGFTAKGQELLRRMKKEAKLPVLLSAARSPVDSRYLELDTQASAVYMLAQPGHASASSMFRDFTDRPIIIE